VLFGWIALFLGLTVVSHTLGNRYSESFSLPGTDSTAASELLKESGLADRAGDSATVVVRAKNGMLPEPATQDAMTAALDRIRGLSSVGQVVGPYDPTGRGQLSPDGRIAFATVTFSGWGREIPLSELKAVKDIAESLRSPELDAEFGGTAASELKRNAAQLSELVGIGAAAIVLFFAFGSLLAMVLPLIVAILALGTAHAAIGLSTHFLPVSSIAPTLATLVGLGVGIDYALFIVTRYRSGLRAGKSFEDAAIEAMNTAGRAVIFAGATVAVALLGLVLLGVDLLSGMGIASGAMVLFAVVATVTLLPAMFGFAGMKVFNKKERGKLAVGDAGIEMAQRARWERLAHAVEARPGAFGAVALLFVVALAAPTLTLKMGSSDQGNDPSGWGTRKAYDMIAEGFGPGFNGPLVMAARVPDATAAQAFSGMIRSLEVADGIAAVVPLPVPDGSTVQVLQIFPVSSPQDDATIDLVHYLRDSVIPALTSGTGVEAHIGGTTAVFADFGEVLNGKLPLFVVVVVLLGCLLLMLAFRSVLIPVTAAAMNILSAGAGLGVVVLIFQWGWGSELMNLGKAGPVESFLPVMMLAILFGLSMDYQVFLVSRMHEEWLATGDNSRAVRVGQIETSRVISAAATIMVCVFLAFVLTGQRAIAEFGFGLAAAIFLDAVILRTMLVPAAMHLIGSANWWLPKPVDRVLPHLSVEAPSKPRAEVPVPVVPAPAVPVAVAAMAAVPAQAVPGPAAPATAPPPAAVPVPTPVPAVETIEPTVLAGADDLLHLDLRGTVRCSNGATPGWAVVTVHDRSGAEVGRAATSRDGTFALPVPRRDQYRVIAHSPGHAPADRIVASTRDIELVISRIDAPSATAAF
jgi:RND superfamily putative drug exporter